MLVFVLLAAFFAGQMVGRTPNYLGKALRATEMKLLALYLLVLPCVILGGTAASVLLGSARRSAFNPCAHGFTEIFYAFASAANGNGSAFAGLNANTDWYNTALGVVMLAGRFLPMLAVLALGGSLARVRVQAPTSASAPTAGPTFGVLLLGVVLLLGGLTYLPALLLGPLSESLR